MINYQGRLYDPSGMGGPLTGAQQVEFRIYDSLSGGTLLWGRRFAVNCSDGGQFNVLISDSGTSIAGTNDLPAVFLGKDRFLELTVVGHGTAISPRQQLVSAPYAMQSIYAVDATSASKGFVVTGDLIVVSGGANISGLATLKAGLTVLSNGVTVGGTSTLNNGMTVIGETTNKGSLTVTNNLTVTPPGSITGYGTIPIGGIIPWSGSVAEIPDGWALCNGTTNSGQVTPDLRGRFVVAAGSSYTVGSTGGVASVALTVNQMPAHNHTSGVYKYLLKVTGSYTTDGETDSTATEPDIMHEGSMATVGANSAHENRPLCYALCFIMRVR